MSVTYVDFIARTVISKPIKAPSKMLGDDMFSEYDRQVQDIINRYGDKMPNHAPNGIYPQNFKGNKFDAYGYGNIHNSVHQYKDEGKLWNRPMPFPADLRAIDAYLKTRTGKTATLGHKSDAFMWMDLRYKMTKSILELANKYKVTLTINTMSDLIAHEDYADLVQQGGHKVVMQMGFNQPKNIVEGFEYLRFDTEEIERKVSPGAPCLKRRKLAIQKLSTLGVTVKTVKSNVNDLTEAQKKFVNSVTGLDVRNLVI